MVEIKKGRINWMDFCNNYPSLELLIDRFPDNKERRYEQRGSIYYSELEGVASFHSYTRPGDGYGGRCFTITMQDGSTKDLIGPWSSGSTAVNSVGFGPCIDVAMVDDEASYERGYTFYASSVTMELLGTYKDRIEVPPYRFRMEEPWRIGTLGFSHRLVFPEGSRFTVLEHEKETRYLDPEASDEQAAAFGRAPQFTPIVQLPDGRYWLKPRSWKEPPPIPEGAVVEEIQQARPAASEVWPL